VTRVLIVAASPLARIGLQNMLAAIGFDVAASLADIHDLAGQLLETEPDAVVIDASGDTRDQILDELTSTEIVRETAVVFVTDDPPPGWITDAIRSGARAVLPSDVSPGQLRIAIEAATSGFVILPSVEVAAFIPASAPPSVPLAELPEALTKREREVLQMLASGLGNKEIATRLSISEHTAKFHVASILGKLGASTRTEAVSIGIRRGLVLL
jgi:DNA-binding NarL/FixJ family response regulator